MASGMPAPKPLKDFLTLVTISTSFSVIFILSNHKKHFP